MPFDLIEAAHDPVCPVCKDVFQQNRSNKRYCSPKCRKQHHQKKDRAEKPRNAQKSPEVAAENRKQRERAKDLARNLYEMPPSCRLGYMKDLIEAARNRDASLRSIFTNPNLLNANRSQPWLFHRRCSVTYMTISQAANEYCKRFWDSSVGPVVKNEVAEPETGEVIE